MALVPATFVLSPPAALRKPAPSAVATNVVVVVFVVFPPFSIVCAVLVIEVKYAAIAPEPTLPTRELLCLSASP